MNIEDLNKIFTNEKISKSIYSLNGGVPDDKVCIDKTKGIWRIYYAERGGKNILGEFCNEDEACRFMYDRVMDIVTGRVK